MRQQKSIEIKAVNIVKKLKKNGYIAYLCGGCVRDILLKRQPKDYDIVTNASSDQIIKLFRRTVAIGIKFGIIQVLQDDDCFEIATFRRDGEYKNGRHPETVTPSDEKEDALRRDFTINGLFFDPVEQKIIDYVEGQQDIERALIRTIKKPYDRFQEDHLRLMRAIRFAAQLNFKIEDKTWVAINNMANLIQDVSIERIREELFLMLRSQYPAKALLLLYRTKLLHNIFGQFFKILRNNSLYCDSSLNNILVMLELANPIKSNELALIILLHGFFDLAGNVNERLVGKICRYFSLSNKSSEHISYVILNYYKVQKVFEMSTATFKRFLRSPFINTLLEFYRLFCLAKNKSLAPYYYCMKKLKELSLKDLFPKPLVNGDNLIELGFSPGPIFKEILFILENKQLSGEIKDYSQAVSFIKNEFLC